MHVDRRNFEMPSSSQVAVASDAFRLLSDPTRIKLLWALLQGESSVSCLAELVGASPTAVSQHLSKLRWAKLVSVRREGTFAYYSAADEHEHVARLLAEALFEADQRALGLPERLPSSRMRHQSSTVNARHGH